ncbi:MAG TPA: haloacid dehalogenase type II [Trueperaceae bacterium]
MRRVIVFAVTGTLLDPGALDPLFTQGFGSSMVRREWFGQMLRSMLVSTITRQYPEFGKLAAAALAMTERRHALELEQSVRVAILDNLRALPPFPEVAAGLARLREAGRSLAALSNMPHEVVVAQLASAGILEDFDEVLSADAARRRKPAPEPYRMAAERLGVESRGMRLVSAHAWDIAGATHAGCATAFVQHAGAVLDPLFVRPDVVGANLTEVVEGILQAEA